MQDGPTSDVLLLRCSFFRTSCLLDVKTQLLLGLVAVDRPRGDVSCPGRSAIKLIAVMVSVDVIIPIRRSVAPAPAEE